MREPAGMEMRNNEGEASLAQRSCIRSTGQKENKQRSPVSPFIETPSMT